MIIKPRTFVRIFSFVAAAMLAMLGVVIQNSVRTMRYRQQIELGYIRALQEVSSSVNAIAVDMQKGTYAGTPAQLSTISAKVWKEAGAAKATLGSLPIGELNLDTTYRFLSQVGDYSMYLSRKAANGEAFTAEERQNYQKLTEYAAQISKQLGDIQWMIADGEVTVEEFLSLQVRVDDEEELPASAGIAGFQDVEDGLQGYPTLIYDGPFSDNLLEREPLMTKTMKEITRGEGREIAAAFARAEAGSLKDGHDENSKMPSYHYTGGTVDVGVTKQGGLVTYLVDSRYIGDRKISVSSARKRAGGYLEEMGIDSMKETYYEVANGICTVNFAWQQEGVTCYTDLVKVGVAMDNGDVVFYDARGFINNHQARDLPEPALTATEAAQSLSPQLRTSSSALVLIPTEGRNEVLAYEFRCKGSGGQDVLVYVNAATGTEEQILILIESENGVLTM